MSLRVYNYRNLGKLYQYKLVHDFSIIDLIEEKCIKEYEISQNFGLKMIGKNSGGSSVFDMAVTSIKLPADLDDALAPAMINFLYDYQRVTDHVILILKDTGEVDSVDNVKEIQHKWNSLKARLLLLPEDDNVNNLLEQGEADFGEGFNYVKTISQSPIFDIVFPAFHNRFLEQEEPVSKKRIKALTLPELDLEIENFFKSDENSVFIESVFYQEQLPVIKANYSEIDKDTTIESLFFKGLVKYEVDAADHVLSAESIKIETLNGAFEVISHLQLKLNGN